jgi:hypothetical protein
MVTTVLSVDDGSPSAFPFAVFPKIGGRICFRSQDRLAHATITGLRRAIGPDGGCLVLVSARSS